MKRITPKSIVWLAVMLFAVAQPAAAQKTELTKTLRDTLESRSTDISKMRFYIDRDITLTAEMATYYTRMRQGKVKKHDDQWMDAITLHRGTAGICTELGPDRIVVQFDEAGGTMTFIANPTLPDQPYHIKINGGNASQEYMAVSYKGRTFYLQGKDRFARLMVSLQPVKGTIKLSKKGMKEKSMD